MKQLPENIREQKIKYLNRFLFKTGIIKPLLLNLVSLGGIIYSFGQASIKGRIKNGQKDLPFATVLLLSSDSALVKESVTGHSGEFIFENVAPGRYLVSSTMVGYFKFLSQPITIDKKDIIVPDIILEEAATELGEVVIKSERPMLEQKIDKLVINLQRSINSSGNTILEILEKSPGVVVNRQNNSITMNGKSGVQVMINDKLVKLPLDVVVQMLDGMNSANVEKIELITSPPAKYDAEGNAGIIHIVMKRNTDIGTNGSFGFTLGYRWAETLGGNFSLNHRTKRFAFFLDYSILRDHNLHLMKMTRQSIDSLFVQIVNDESHRENVTTQQNLNAGFEWKLNNNTLLNLGFAGYRRNWDMNAITNDNNHASRDSTVITTMNIHESNIWQSGTGTIGLQTKIDPKTDISFNLDYLYYHNNNPSDYLNKLFYEQLNLNEFSKIDLKKTTPIRFVVARADYQYNLTSSFTLEGGVKAVISKLDNDVMVQREINTVLTTDPDFTSYSTLDEETGAIYVSSKWKTGRQWQFNSGLRYEYTHTAISTPTQKNLIDRKHGYLFPSLFLKRDLGKEMDLQFSYSRRITRPTYNDIAPFVFFWGPNTFSAGNTSLYPAISDAINAGYHKKQWIISLQFSHSKNEISFLQPEIDSQSNNLIYRSQNLKYLNTAGLSNSLSINVTYWWKVQTNLTGQYQIAQTSQLRDNGKFHLYGLNFNLVNLLKLPKDFSIEISGMYQSRLLSGISEYLPVGSLNAGIQKKIGEKGVLRLAMDDIFKTNYWKIKTYNPQNNLDSYFKYDFNDRFIRLTYNRNFGNNKLRSVKLKSGSEEERERISK